MHMQFWGGTGVACATALDHVTLAAIAPVLLLLARALRIIILPSHTIADVLINATAAVGFRIRTSIGGSSSSDQRPAGANMILDCIGVA